MWITKGAAFIRGRRLFEARRLLEEIHYLHIETSVFVNLKGSEDKELNHVPPNIYVLL